MAAVAATAHHAHPDAEDDQATCGLKRGNGNPEDFEKSHAAKNR
jgi:hypothetical protein